MKYLFLFLFLTSSVEARTPVPLGSFTSGSLQLYKTVARDNPGWADGADASYNSNFDIIASSMTGLINGTLGIETTGFIKNQGTLDVGTSFYVLLGSATSMRASSFTATHQFLGVNDNISAPSYSWLAEPTLGFRRPSVGLIDVVSSGVTRARFSSNGVSAVDGGVITPGFNFLDEPSMGLRRVSTGIIWLMANGVAIATGTASSQRMEFYTIQTGTSTSVGPACATGYTRAGLSHCYDTDSVKAVDITSVPANTVSDFTTTNLAALNSTNAKFAIFRVKCQTSQDATDGVNDVSLFMRKGGGSGSKDNSTSVCDTRGRIGSAAGEAYYFDTNEVTIALDANKDFDYACETTETGNDVACYISLVGYIE